jgi:pimeloyl-ACP methyl ester carboxylesterase
MRRLIAGSILMIVLAGCSGTGGDTATNGASSPSPAASQVPPGEVNGKFDVGDYQLHLTCKGSGAPTVVYFHGLGGAGADVDEAIAPRLTDRLRVCSYDRVNVGQSDSQQGRHTGEDSVRDLHALLTAAAVPGPYLLIGFSFGGLLASMYAGSIPTRCAGCC